MAVDTILGLPTSAQLASLNQRFFSWRRKIVHAYPTGNAPLTAILSMVDNEVASDSVINWFEKRFISVGVITRGTAPLTKTAPATGDSDDGTIADNTSVSTAGTAHYLKVSTIKNIRPGYVIQTVDATGLEHQLWITAIVTGVTDQLTNGYLVCKFFRPDSSFVASAWVAGTAGQGVGTAIAEAASGGGITPLPFQLPVQVMNQTQIFRTPFEFSGTALQEGVKWDETGIYKERAKDASVEHMVSLEKAVIFSRRSTTTQLALDGSGRSQTVRTMSGLLEFLRLWDAGSTGLQIDGATYAPYSYRPAATTDADDNKRVIANSDGVLSVERFHGWCERVSRYSSNRTNQKLILCGNGAATVFATMFRKETMYQSNTQQNVYGLSVNTIHTPYGEYHIVTHPLFNDNVAYRNSMLILDVWNLKFRALSNRDTQLLTNRQNNGDDYRRDEYLTEATLEFVQPDSCMFVQSVTKYQAS